MSESDTATKPGTPEDAFKVLEQAVEAWWSHRQVEGRAALNIVYAELFGFEWSCPVCSMTGGYAFDAR